jgi:thiaminase
LAVELTGTLDADLPHEKFSAVCRRHFPVWKERLFSHPLWQRLGTGEASRVQFLGWLIESYHFIEGVNDRLALAVAECYDHRVRPLFARHYTEEYDHGHFFVKSLAALGYDEPTVSSARPLPSTLAILNFMRQCARRDLLQYAVCSGFLESTGGDRLRARDFYARLAQHYEPDRPGAFKPLLDHVNLDEAYGHNNMMESIFERLVRIPAERASAALTAGALLVETLELWSTDILRTYDRPHFTPRIGPASYRPTPAATYKA